MMSVRLRYLPMLARWGLAERRDAPQRTSRLPLRVWWADCDLNRHMNNSRYLALMDMGRWHYMLVSGLGQEIWQRGWFPVVARIEIDFKKSLNPGDRFVLETLTERVGTKSATLVQRFWLGETLAAEARVTAIFKRKGESQALAPLYETMPHLQSPLLKAVPEEASVDQETPISRSSTT